MKNFAPLFLSQSYQDTWDDYIRSLSSEIFPVWDYVILTASNEDQAEGYRMQIEQRKDYLSTATHFAVIPDEGGVRLGSGGTTLSVIRYIYEQEKIKCGHGHFDNLRILVIHSGGDSKRVPIYSALGKLFSPVPHKLPDDRSSTLFDEFLIVMSSVPVRIREGCCSSPEMGSCCSIPCRSTFPVGVRRRYRSKRTWKPERTTACS